MIEVLAAMAESDCERLRSGWLAQPANAISSLAYVAVGIWLLRRSRGRAAGVAGGVGMIAAGVGSLAYHGPQPTWGHVLHDVAVVALAAVIAKQLLAPLFRRSTRPLVVAGLRKAAVWLVPALAAYIAGRSGSPLCFPAAVWQPHAAWHALSAVGLGLALQPGSSRRGVGYRTQAPAAARR
jgi:hypothetical protein